MSKRNNNSFNSSATTNYDALQTANKRKAINRTEVVLTQPKQSVPLDINLIRQRDRLAEYVKNDTR
jgi:hypothetical protein